MKDRKYIYLLVLISVVILTTLSIQVYWNYKNYEESKKQLIADVQTSLDQSVDEYFTTRARENTLGIFYNGPIKSGGLQDFFDRMDMMNLQSNGKKSSLKDIDVTGLKGIRVVKGVDKDSIDRLEEFFKKEGQSPFLPPEQIENESDSSKPRRFNFPENTSKPASINSTLSGTGFRSDSVSVSYRFREEVTTITSKIVMSMTDDTIDVSRVDSIFNSKLKSKNIDLDHYIARTPEEVTDTIEFSKKPFKAVANSSLIKNGQEISVHYGNLTMEVLKRNLTGIVLSFLLVASVIFCLFYLLVVINNEKELSSMKNDLISNITHEFKTPIATAGAALEGVQSFTATGDVEKTNRYLEMGRSQLIKLNTMVEKLLETATLDSKDLVLQKSQLDLTDLLESAVLRFKNQSNKEITFHSSVNTTALIMADQFHLENAFNNLLDNAIKYGGDQVQVALKRETDGYEITVSDSGTSLDSKHVKRLFDKFYRVGSGNKHNVKGFGIGLFYTKAIIEKHSGSITVQNKPQTTFKIILPYE